MVVHQVAFAPTAHRMVAHPRLSLVTLRTIDGHTLVVGANAPEGILHHAIEHGIGGLESIERLHRVADHFAEEGRRVRKARFVAVSWLDALLDRIVGIGIAQHHDFGKTETVVGEAWSPYLVLILLSGGDVVIGDLGITQVLDIEARRVGEAVARAIACPRLLFGPRCTNGRFEFFGKTQTESVALVEVHHTDRHTHPACKVLSEVEQDASVLGETNVARRKHFLHHHRGRRVAAHLANG